MRTVSKFVKVALLYLLLNIFGCAGGGSSTTSGLRIQGVVLDLEGRPIASVLVEDLKTANSAFSDNYGMFFIHSSIGSELSFIRDGERATVLLDNIPSGALLIDATFAVSFVDRSAAIVALDVLEGNPPSPDGPPVDLVPTNPIATLMPTSMPSETASIAMTPTIVSSAPLPTSISQIPTSTPEIVASVPPVSSTPTVLIPSPTTTLATNPTPTVACLGDVDCNGVRDFIDIECLNQLVATQAGGPPACPPETQCNSRGAADLVNDGVINTADVDAFVALLGLPC